MSDLLTFVALESVRWHNVTQASWQRMLGASASAISAWRNGRAVPRASSMKRIKLLAEVRKTALAGLGQSGFEHFLHSRPAALDGQMVVSVLSGTDQDQVRVLDVLRAHIAFNKAEDARIEALLGRPGPVTGR